MPSTAQLFSQVYDKALIRYQNNPNRSKDFPELSAGDSHYIEILYGLGKTSLTDFAAKAGISRPAASRIIQNFTKKGYVLKTPSRQDKRVSYLELVPDLQEHSRRNFLLADQVFMEMLSVLSDQEQEDLHRLIEKINKEF
ncbi:MarR family winged helix-turn-helix transcriptional regulator [Streptococcus dentasini]